MSALLQAIGKHVASAPEPMRKGAKSPMPSKSDMPASTDSVPSEDGQPQDLHTLHAHLAGLVPDSLHKELAEAIQKHMASKGA